MIGLLISGGFFLIGLVPGASTDCYYPFRLEIDFSPRTLLAVALDGDGLRVSPGAVFVGTDNEKWGVIDAKAELASKNVLVLVSGEAGEMTGFVLSDRLSDGQSPDCRTVSDISANLIGQQKAIEDLGEAKKEIEEDISRLKNDADVIGNINRIVEAEDDLQSIQREVDLTAASKALLEDRLVVIRKQSNPRSFNRRESELSAQLVELAATSRGISAATRQSEAQQELNRKMELIESTKNQHEELLKRELARLRKERASLESATKISITP